MADQQPKWVAALTRAKNALRTGESWLITLVPGVNASRVCDLLKADPRVSGCYGTEGSMLVLDSPVDAHDLVNVLRVVDSQIQDELAATARAAAERRQRQTATRHAVERKLADLQAE